MSEGTYKLPSGWRWTTLNDVCEINPRRSSLNFGHTELASFVPMSAVDESTGTIPNIQTRLYADVRTGYTYFEEQDVLFAKITPCMENGKAAIAWGLIKGVGFGSTEFHVLRPRKEVLAQWVWLFVRQERFRKGAKRAFRGGVGQQRVPQEFLATHPIPLAPVEEQYKIVAKVEALMERLREAKRLRAEAHRDAERLTQAALAEVFPRPGKPLPHDWRWVKIGEVADFLNGYAFKPTDWKETGRPIIRIQNLTGTSKKFNYYDGKLSERYLVRDRDLLVAWSASLGVFVWFGGEAWVNQHIFKVCNIKNKVEKNYLYYVLQHSIDEIKAKTHGSAMKHVTRNKFLSTRIPLPPLDEQRRVVVYLDQIQAQVRAIKKAQDETEKHLQRLEQAILDKAFRGEL